MLCIQQQCRGNNYLRDGHLKGLDIWPVGRNRMPLHLSTRALFDLHFARSPLCIFPQLTPGVKHGFQPYTRNVNHNASNAMYATSGWHGWNLSCDMACVKLEACLGPCVACVKLAYGAVCRRSPHAHTLTYSFRCLPLSLTYVLCLNHHRSVT